MTWVWWDYLEKTKITEKQIKLILIFHNYIVTDNSLSRLFMPSKSIKGLCFMNIVEPPLIATSTTAPFFLPGGQKMHTALV